MNLYVPCTIDLQKHQSSGHQYGLEHINKLLEDELSQLRSLKSERPKDSLLPTLKATNRTTSEVEGFKDYQRQAEQVRSSDPKHATEEHPLKNVTSTIVPFAERYNDFPKEKNVLEKGQMPFFKVGSDGHSLSCRLPRLSERRAGKTKGHAIKGLLDDAGGQRLNSKRSERGKQVSGKLVRSSFGVKPDYPIRRENSDPNSKDLLNNLRIQNCDMTVRQDSFCQGLKEKSPLSLHNNRSKKKTFHLACTRADPNKYKTTERNDDCSFCAGPVFLQSRCDTKYGDGIGQRMRDRKAQVGEKPYLPRLEKSSTEKNKIVRDSCKRCKKRLEQAEVNRIALATAGGSRKLKNNDSERKVKNRLVTKEKEEKAPETLPVDKKESVLPLIEYTAYMDQDGSLFLLPGAFTLRRKDYNIWSRYKKSSDEKTFRSQTIMTGTTLPYISR